MKWLAEYCGTSVTMIEKHYGKYIGGYSEEQFSRLIGAKTETFSETQVEPVGTGSNEVLEKYEEEIGGPTWIRTRTKEKNAQTSNHECCLSFFIEEQVAA